MKNALLASLLGLLIAAIFFQPWNCGTPSSGLRTVKMSIGRENPPSDPEDETDDGKPNSGLRNSEMSIGEAKFTLEVADTPRLRNKGLMYRDSMSKDHGMIFVFASEEKLSFWMKNTNIPLDILFLDSSGTIVSIHQMKPHDLRGTPSEKPALYAIELNEGTAKRVGVKIGDKLKLPEDLGKAKD
jgi:uncharacterized membrane protein (UPF0127 family)